MLRRATAIALVIVAGATSSAEGQTGPDVDVWAPSFYATAEVDEPVRFAWWPDNSQDFYRIVFSQFRSLGWESSTYSSRETVLTTLTASPSDLGLSPGTWYWRICFGWNDSPGTCYLDDDIRTLDVSEPDPVLSYSDAVAATRQAVRRRYAVTPRVRCARINVSEMLCRADFRRRGRTRTRVVSVEAKQDGVYYAFRSG